MSPGLWRLSAGELIEGYGRGDFSPVEVLEECLERIDKLNPLLHAYLAVNEKDARLAARAAESRWRCVGEKPLLCGVPVSVKDTIEMCGMPTSYGSLAFKSNYQEDSEIVLRLRRAGAVILGKTNTPEFALLPTTHNRLGPPGCNPWNLRRTCGGSSGGAAAAVAAGLGPLAVGTDSGGSIRLPAAYNGIFGLKPTYQRIPTVQRWRAAPGRSHNGPLSRTVHDSALLMQALAGSDERDPDSRVAPVNNFLEFHADLRGRRVALVRRPPGSAPEPGAAAAVEEVVPRLKELGLELREDEPPLPDFTDELEPGAWGYAGDHLAAAESLVPGFWEKHSEELTDYAKPIYEAGHRVLAWRYRQLLGHQQGYRSRMVAWFAAYDFLVSPIAGVAPAHQVEDRATRTDGVLKARPFPFLTLFNSARNPAAAVPVGFHDGLPLAVQVVGRVGNDVGVLNLSAAIATAMAVEKCWPQFVAN